MKNKWFTLIELLVVITIFAILWTISLISFKEKEKQDDNAYDILNITEKKCFEKCDLINKYDQNCKKNCLFPNRWLWE